MKVTREQARRYAEQLDDIADSFSLIDGEQEALQASAAMWRALADAEPVGYLDVDSRLIHEVPINVLVESGAWLAVIESPLEVE